VIGSPQQLSRPIAAVWIERRGGLAIVLEAFTAHTRRTQNNGFEKSNTWLTPVVLVTWQQSNFRPG
jgi:hypothetical protein